MADSDRMQPRLGAVVTIAAAVVIALAAWAHAGQQAEIGAAFLAMDGASSLMEAASTVASTPAGVSIGQLDPGNSLGTYELYINLCLESRAKGTATVRPHVARGWRAVQVAMRLSSIPTDTAEAPSVPSIRGAATAIADFPELSAFVSEGADAHHIVDVRGMIEALARRGMNEATAADAELRQHFPNLADAALNGADPSVATP